MGNIRLARPGDLPGIATVVNHYIEHGTQHFATTPLSEDAVGAFALRDDHPCFVLASEPVDGHGVTIKGAAWSAPHKSREAYGWTVDVAVYVHPDAQGHGVGSRLQAKVIDCIRAQGYVSALAVIGVPNEASVRLHEQLGFEAIGVLPQVGYKRDAWRDIGIWHLALREVTGAPAAIRSVREVLSANEG